MAQVQRNDIDRNVPPAQHGYDAGGHIARLQADLAQRLAGEGLASVPVSVALPAERVVRFVSVAGGYAALLAGYAAVALAIAWLV